MEWVHCNICFCVPSAGSSLVFFITSCGHLCCNKCLVDDNPNNAKHCLLCKKPAVFTEINRNLRSDLQMLFRNPKEITGEYSQRIKTVAEFQNTHRSRLQQHVRENYQKAVKYARAAESEISKRVEKERMIISERNEATVSLENAKKRLRELEESLVQRDQEIKRMRANRQSPFSHHRSSIPRSTTPFSSNMTSLKTQTPVDSVSFVGCTTSTPIDTGFYDMTTTIGKSVNGSGCGGLIATCGTSNNSTNNPSMNALNAYERSVSGNAFLNTPALLGLVPPDCIGSSGCGKQMEFGGKFDGLF